MSDYSTADAQPLTGLMAIPLEQIHPSPNNPRENLTGIDELAQSINEQGLIQPLVVQRVPGLDGYQIVAGHRRHAACRKIRWHKVPCIVRRDMLPDEELLAMLVENGQRAGLDPIEEARALNRLRLRGMSLNDVARKIGRSYSHVNGRLHLLSLPIEEQEEIRQHLVGVTAGIEKAKVEAGRVRGGVRKTRGTPHLGITHELADRVKARCRRLGHSKGKGKGVGGVGCGACWESVIRADERQHIHQVSADQGRCVICGTEHTDVDTANAAELITERTA
jgi:ParB family chromosome partitioning protein